MSVGEVGTGWLRSVWARSLPVFVLLGVLTGQLVHVAWSYSANWDEAHHLYDGYRIWRLHDYRLNAEVPPLIKVAAALPILHLHPVLPAEQVRSQSLQAFRGGRAFVFGNGGDGLLLRARLACLSVTVLLAVLVFAATCEWFGYAAGLCGLALWSFDPNVLAHGTLISTDMGSALFLFASVYAFYRYGEEPTASRLLMVGAMAGCAMGAKFTGVFVWPMLVLLAAGEALSRRNWGLLGRRLGAIGAALVCALVVVWALYSFRYAPASAGLELSPRLAPYLDSVPGKGSARMLEVLARTHVLPEAYVWGLANTKITEWEFTSYFWGRMYRHGPWMYFPIAFLIKSTLPLLLLLGLAPMLLRWEAPATGRKLTFLVVPVLFYFALVTTSHMDIGARHLMPVYPFLYALAGFVLARMWRRGRGWAVAAVLLLLWQGVTTVRAAPAYMAYGNEAWGGPPAVHRYLSDANVDWGQQLKAVKVYLDQNHIQNCWFAYFPDGAVEPADYGVHCRRLPTGSSLWWFKLPMEVPPVISGTVLISDSDLEGVESGDGPLNWFEPFRGLKPVAAIQQGVYVYQGTFAVPLMSALVDVRSSADLAKAGRLDEALTVAWRAAGLAPGSAIVQMNLADRLATLGAWQEALVHYRLGGDLARTVRPELEDADLVPRSEAGVHLAEARMAGR